MAEDKAASVTGGLVPQAITIGLIVAFVGCASSVAVVVGGLKGIGASDDQTALGLAVLLLAMGVASIAIALATRQPINIVWSTPGMALLATTAPPAGGFAEVIGAFVLVALAVMLTGLWKTLGKLVAAIPRPIANAMLAGILLPLCLAPFKALMVEPVAAALILVTWALMLRLARLWAVPAALAVALAAIAITGGNAAALDAPLLPPLTPLLPEFSLTAALSIALPLYLVTMASQNIPGLTVLATFGYQPPTRPIFLTLGGLSVLTAPFGAGIVNFSVITAALCAGPDAGPDPKQRWQAVIACGIGYLAFIPLAGVATAVIASSAPVLVQAVAGLALIGAFSGAVQGAVAEERLRLPALVTLLVTTSGLTVVGIGAAFWGLVLGLAMAGLEALRLRDRSRP